MSVSTVKVVDPRIEPQPDPVYLTTVSPTQSQYYSLPASGKSNSYITFNNIVTRGTNKAYLDTFQLRITATLTLTIANTSDHELYLPSDRNDILPNSFPFNRCCDEIRVNINGGAFFSQPLAYLAAKERYWDQKRLCKSFQNVTPCIKPYLQNERGTTTRIERGTEDTVLSEPFPEIEKYPSRMNDPAGFAYGPGGTLSSRNQDILPLNIRKLVPSGEARDIAITMTWEEPICGTPFSSRYDETYGRPLYNLTSMDIAFNLQDLGNMFRIKCIHDDYRISSYSVNIDDCQLLYQVMTIPPSITPPSYTVVPYRRFVPYITDSPSPVPLNPADTNVGSTMVSITSGVYTLNEIPQAIWIFATHPLSAFQTNPRDGLHGWTCNKLAVPIRHISISMGNTTQILNTATDKELYRIAKANGCQDSWSQFGMTHLPMLGTQTQAIEGVGSYLRLIPGTDITIPNEQLIPGSNANNMVFQVQADFEVPNSWYVVNTDTLPTTRPISLWLLFEYNGVATWTPGQCQITMNPVTPAVAASAQTILPSAVTTTPTNPESTSSVEGSGWLDNIGQKLKDMLKSAVTNKWFSKTLKMFPNPIVQSIGGFVDALGGDEIHPAKRARGGAVMGMGDFV